MIQKIILLSFCLFSLAQCFQNTPYTYFVFDREWGPTVCKHQDCIQEDMDNYNGKNFNTHGLWSNGSEEDQCIYWSDCNDVTYEQSEISDSLLKWMDDQYVGLYHPSDEFRKHEYEKHGSCFNYPSEITQTQKNADLENYFFEVIQFQCDRYDLLRSFAKGGIYPNDELEWSLKELKQALAMGLGKNTNLANNLSKLYCIEQDGKQYLEVIELCLSADGNFDLMQFPKCDDTNLQCDSNTKIIFPESFQFNQNTSDRQNSPQNILE